MTRTLGIDLANLSDDLRKKFKIRDTVKGIVILNVAVQLACRRQAAQSRRCDR